MRQDPIYTRATQTYFGPDVFVTRGANEGETNQKDVGLGVGQWAEPVVVLLSSSIPQPERDGLSVDHDICRVIVEHWVGSESADSRHGNETTAPVGMYSP
jgi:hypothetical protein